MAKLSDLHFDKRNARKHPQRNMGAIMQSLQEVGAARSIVIDEENVILAGNGVIEAAGQVGIENVRIIEADGNEIIAVKRKGLTQEQKTRLALFDNRAGELAEWNTDELQTLLDEGFNFDGLFFENELDALLAELHTDVESGLLEDADPDAIPESVETRCKPGDLWQLGRHRLLCGDSTSATDVERLMGGKKASMAWFDPPFGIALQPPRGLTESIANDGNADARLLWEDFLPLLKDAMRPDTMLFLCQGWSEFDWTLPLVREFFTVKSKIVWKKAQWGIGYYLRPQHEDILFCFYGEPKVPDTAISDVWEYARPNAPIHAAEKPVALSQCAIEYATNPEEIVIDWFAGVGGSIMACEVTGRTCYGIEIEPKYCDVILTRWERATGKVAELVNGTTNEI